ncbi:hypothetical protein DESC_740095 [Desulfosarcina cetonica]|nr:hypothetical protein DESC_740095 [Desulfosarcina cetonica]
MAQLGSHWCAAPSTVRSPAGRFGGRSVSSVSGFFNRLFHLGQGLSGHAEAVFRSREGRGADLLAIGLDGLDDRGPDFGVLLDKLGHEAVEEPHHVMGHQHLSVHVHAGADANHRNGHRFGDQAPQGGGHRLGDDGEGAGRLNRLGILDDAPGRGGVLALNLEPAQGAGGLGREADVALDGNSGLDDGLDHRREIDPAFQLHAITSAFLHQPSRIDDGVANAGVIAHEGHVANHHRPFAAAHHRLNVMNHHFQGDGNRSFEPQDDHSQGVAHQNHVHPGFIGHQSEGVVVGGDHHQLAAVLLGLDNTRYTDFCFRHDLSPLTSIVALKGFHQRRQGPVDWYGHTEGVGRAGDKTINGTDFGQPVTVHILAHGRTVGARGGGDLKDLFHGIPVDDHTAGTGNGDSLLDGFAGQLTGFRSVQQLAIGDAGQRRDGVDADVDEKLGPQHGLNVIHHPGDDAGPVEHLGNRRDPGGCRLLPGADDRLAGTGVTDRPRFQKSGPVGRRAGDDAGRRDGLGERFGVTHAVLQGQDQACVGGQSGGGLGGSGGMHGLDEKERQIHLSDPVRVAGGRYPYGPQPASAFDGQTVCVHRIHMILADVQQGHGFAGLGQQRTEEAAHGTCADHCNFHDAPHFTGIRKIVKAT